MLSKDGIEDFTKQVVPYLHITTKIPGKKDDDLLLKRGYGGFPTLEFMDAEGQTLAALHYTKRSLEGFQESLAQVVKLQDLKARADTDLQAAKDLLLLKMAMKTIRYAEASAAAKDLEFSDKERLAYETALVETLSRLGIDKARKELATLDLLAAPRARAEAIIGDLVIRKALRPLMRGFRPGIDPEPPYHLAYELYKKGTLPSDKPYVDTLYWSSVSRTAFKQKDIKAFEVALDRLRSSISKSNARWLKNLESQLETLKQLGQDK